MNTLLRAAAWVTTRPRGDAGASAVEYGLLAAAVTAAFIAGTAGFNGVLGEIFQKALDGLGATTP